MCTPGKLSLRPPPFKLYGLILMSPILTALLTWWLLLVLSDPADRKVCKAYRGWSQMFLPHLSGR